MTRFLTWMLRPVINAVLDERASREATAKAFEMDEPLTYSEVMARRDEFLRLMGVIFAKAA